MSSDVEPIPPPRRRLPQNTIKRMFCAGCSTFDVPVRDRKYGEHRVFTFDGKPSALCSRSGQPIPEDFV